MPSLDPFRAPRLRTYLLVALALRLPAVWLQNGYEFADHQYQSIEPAWHLATGLDWCKTWEWELGIRSYVYPGLLAGMLRAGLALGLDDASAALCFARGLHALGSLLPLWALWLVLVRWQRVARPGPALWLVAASGPLAWVGVQTCASTWSATLVVAGVLAFHGPGRGPPFLAGIALGLAFCGRMQDALFPLALGAGALLRRQTSRALWLGAGCAGPVLLQGLVDRIAWGGFLSSPLAYFRVNALEGAASKWQTQPWWFYGAVTLAVVALFPPFLAPSWRALRQGCRVLPWAVVGALTQLLVHSAIARKSLRFVYAALLLLLIVQAVGLLAGAPERPLPAATRRLRVWVLVLAMATLVLGSLYSPNRGPVAAARHLAAQPDFHGHLAVVGGDATSVGGFAHLARPAIEVEPVARGELDAWLTTGRGEPSWLVVARDPLDAATLARHPRLELRGEFHDIPSLRRGTRRWVYWLPGAEGSSLRKKRG